MKKKNYFQPFSSWCGGGDFFSSLKAKITQSKGEEKEEKEEEFLDFDQVLKSIGRYGSWQVRLFVLLSCVALVDGLVESLFEFTAFTPKYRCNIPFCEHPQNTTYFSNSSSARGAKEENNGEVFPIYVLHGIPQKLLQSGESCQYLGFHSMPQMDMEQQAILNKQSCDFYQSEVKRNSSDLKLMRCNEANLVFDDSFASRTIVSAFKLTCGKKWIKKCIQVLFIASQLLGSAFFGFLADCIGRKKALLISLCLTSTCGILAAFIKANPGGFAFFYFTAGLGKAGLFFLAYLLILECSNSHTLALSLYISKVLGGLITSPLAAAMPIWSSLQLLAFISTLLLAVLTAVFANESPRWMIAKGYYEKARDLAKRAASINGKELKIQTLHDSNKKANIEQRPTTAPAATALPKAIIEAISQNDFYKWWLANLVLQWTALGLCSQGQVTKAQLMQSRPHANMAFEALSFLTGIISGLLLLCHWGWGCRPLLTFSHLVSALMLLVQSLGLYLINEHVTLFGHFTANISLGVGLVVLQLLTTWMAPKGTTSRASLFGLCWAFFHIGHLASHPLNAVDSQWIPTAAIATLPALAAFTAFFLPEKGHDDAQLPEKLEDLIVLSQVPKQSYFQPPVSTISSWKAKMKATLGYN